MIQLYGRPFMFHKVMPVSQVRALLEHEGEETGKTLYILAPVSFLICDFFFKTLTKLYSWWLKFPCKIELLFLHPILYLLRQVLVVEREKKLLDSSLRFSFLNSFPQQILCSCG